MEIDIILLKYVRGKLRSTRSYSLLHLLATPLEPSANNPNPRPNNINPKLYLNAAEGLYLLSHHFEKKEANTIIKKELSILNQETVISVVSAVNSLTNIQATSAQILAKHIPSTMLEPGIFLKVCFHKRYKTQVIIANGTTVNNAFTTLKVVAELPTRTLSTLSLAKMIKEEAPCSKDIKKNTVKNANMITAIIRSLTILEYLEILEITRTKNRINPITAIPIGPSIGSPPKSKGKIVGNKIEFCYSR